MYGGGPEEEENRACEELEKMQELFGDHNLPWQFKEREKVSVLRCRFV